MESTPAPVVAEAPVSTESTAPVTDSSSSESVDIESDPNESYSDFLKRTAKESSKPKEPKKEEKKVTSIFDDKPKEEVQPEQSASEKIEEAVEQALKVGEKEYKAKDIEKLSKDYEATTASVREYEAKLNDLTKGVQAFMERLKSDPTVFQSLEIPRNVLEEHYYKTYVEPTIELTPEQKAVEYDRIKKEQVEQAKQQQLEAQKQQETQKAQEMQEFYQNKWVSEIQDIVKAGNLPKSDFVMQRVAGYIRQALDKQLYHVAASDIVKAVQQDVKTLQTQLLQTMSPEEIRATLGDDGYKKIQEDNVKKYNEAKLKAAPIKQQTPSEPAAPKKKYTSPYDLLD